MTITKIRNSVASAAAITSLLLTSMAPAALAADSTLIGGNGSGSSSSVSVSQNHSNTVVQDNYAHIRNSVDSHSSTGGNIATGNTGGDVLVATGNSDQRVTIENMANMNQAQIGGSSQGGAGSASVLGNGSGSQNFLSNTSSHSNSIFQTNDAHFDNSVNLSSETGGNYASDNTGRFGGNSPVRVLTGNATSDVAIGNSANANSASIGGSTLHSAAAGAGWSGLDISGNGSGSLNSADISGNHRNSTVQDNNASFNNNLSQWLSSGDNYASDNTGGDILVGTGSTTALSWLDNKANFNRASLDTGSMTIGSHGARVSGNGSNSDSFYTQTGDHSNKAFQTGNAHFDNILEDYSTSGGNIASDNTGSLKGFSTNRVLSGGSLSDSYVSNQSNYNSYGSSITIPGGWGLSLGWDLRALMGM